VRNRAGVAAVLGLGGDRARARGVGASGWLGAGKERGRDASRPRTRGLKSGREMALATELSKLEQVL
jgi:hypothetical protein